ncbi:hypothetical protein BJ878DRAFT_534833 [Calycina marina]|uniref:NAD(P)-binding protein n=1 Tax=Calycina marina TaxID=1763456 RepID=A0A9P7Z298_9HELO|nr:hypothetical protein BJ878DRAFT_534833 [Calycina marina]
MSKTVIITGASKGIGLGTTESLLKEGHNVFLVARTEEPLRKLKEKFGERVGYTVADLADFETGPKVISQALAIFKTIDALIINHGVLTPMNRIADSTPSEWRSLYNVNVFSALALLPAAIPPLRATNGRIILISSGAATSAYSTWGAYGSSKASLNHLALTLSVEEPLITSIAIRPGTVDTEMQAQIRNMGRGVMDEKDEKKFAGLHAKGELLSPVLVGGVLGRVAVGGRDEGLSGRFLSWNSEELKAYQE